MAIENDDEFDLNNSIDYEALEEWYEDAYNDNEYEDRKESYKADDEQYAELLRERDTDYSSNSNNNNREIKINYNNDSFT